VQRALLSNNSLAVFLLAVFIIGAILFVAGTMVTRQSQARALDAEPPAGRSEGESLLDVAGRIDLIERLVMVGQPWCVEQLDTIRREDPDESVREAAEAALTVIGARSITS
jgi:hypothetical protein